MQHKSKMVTDREKASETRPKNPACLHPRQKTGVSPSLLGAKHKHSGHWSEADFGELKQCYERLQATDHVFKQLRKDSGS